jgi:hypothetical protein
MRRDQSSFLLNTKIPLIPSYFAGRLVWKPFWVVENPPKLNITSSVSSFFEDRKIIGD